MFALRRPAPRMTVLIAAASGAVYVMGHQPTRPAGGAAPSTRLMLSFFTNRPRARVAVAALAALVSWVPLAVWAWTHGVAVAAPGVEDPLLRHYAIHLRFLVAVPLLVLTARGADRTLDEILERLVDSGMVPRGERAEFRERVKDSKRAYVSPVAWCLILAAAAAFNWMRAGDAALDHELTWAGGSAGELSFPRRWFLWVSSPIFILVLGGWLWRLVVVTVLFARIAAMKLDVVATHPDRVGGLGFVMRLPRAFVGFTFSLAALLAGRWGHDMVYHGETLAALRAPLAAAAVVLIVVPCLPLVMFTPKIARLRRQALYDYGRLVSVHGRLVRDRWIIGGEVSEGPVLSSPELGPLTDVNAIYEAAWSARALPLDRESLVPILMPIVIAFLPLLLIEIPLKELAAKILGALL